MVCLLPETTGKHFLFAQSLRISIKSPDIKRYLGRSLERDPEVNLTCICFEITEAAAVGNIAHARDFIMELQQHECRIALDDFGTGLSSFKCLKNLPINYIKIDGEFVKDFASDPHNKAIIESTVHFSQVIGIDVIAESVESQELRVALTLLGVTYVQGRGVESPKILQDSSLDGSVCAADLVLT